MLAMGAYGILILTAACFLQYSSCVRIRGCKCIGKLERLADAVPDAMEKARDSVLNEVSIRDSIIQLAIVRAQSFPVQLSIIAAILRRAAYDLLERESLNGYKYMRVLGVLRNPLLRNHEVLDPSDSLAAPEPSTCPWPKYDCRLTDTYRTIDGSCNNKQHPLWGRQMTPLRRDLPAEFHDGVSSFRKGGLRRNKPLPSARLISVTVGPDIDVPDTKHTALLTEFGQLVDHDLSLTPGTQPFSGGLLECGADECDDTHEACIPIEIPENDPNFADKPCLKFIRSMAVPNLDCTFGARENVNIITSYIDASIIYGSFTNQLLQLRDTDTTRGRLRMIDHPDGLKSMLPQRPNDFNCNKMDETQMCAMSGDFRVNVQTLMTLQHTLWARMHNFIEDQLHALNALWNGEKLFQETRRIVGAIFQHVIYNEFLPTLLGSEIVQQHGLQLQTFGYFTGYDEEVDASISNNFATAAYRFGHSMVQNHLGRLDSDFNPVSDNPFDTLSEVFFRSKFLFTGIDEYLRGMLTDNAQKVDNHFVESLTVHLFTKDPPNGPNADLLALNIQRGRDHGLPAYVKWREWCGLSVPTTFEELTDLPDAIRLKFQELYRRVNDIDLYIAGVSEKPAAGSLLGPTFSCMLGRQFSALRRGDRFWYENDGSQAFSMDQLKEIRKMTLSWILCTMSDNVKMIQPRPFDVPTVSGNNDRVPCSSLPVMDFTKWKN